MSLLTICQDAADVIGIPRPSAVMTSTDPILRRLLALAQMEGQELAKRAPWQALVKEATFATVASTAAYSLPSDLDRLIEGSIYNRTQTRPVIGPITAQKWQQLKSTTTASIWDAFRIRGSEILIHPTPTSADTIAYEYVSSSWCASLGDTAPDQTAWADDTDITFLSERAMTLGLVWRFKHSRGLEYGEDFNTYERHVSELASNDGGMRMLDLSSDTDGTGTYDPYITDGSWSLT